MTIENNTYNSINIELKLKEDKNKEIYFSLKKNKLYLGYNKIDKLKLIREINLEKLAKEYICDTCIFGKNYNNKYEEELKYSNNENYYEEFISYILDNLLNRNILKEYTLDQDIIDNNNLNKFTILNKEYFTYIYNYKIYLLKEKNNKYIKIIDINNICLLVGKRIITLTNLIEFKNSNKFIFEIFKDKNNNIEIFRLDNNENLLKNGQFLIIDEQKYILLKHNLFKLEEYNDYSYEISFINKEDLNKELKDKNLQYLDNEEVYNYINKEDIETIKKLNKILSDFYLELDKIKKLKLKEINEKYKDVEICNQQINNTFIEINKQCNLGKRLLKNNNNINILRENISEIVEDFTIDLLNKIINVNEFEINIFNWLNSIEIENGGIFIEIDLEKSNLKRKRIVYKFKFLKLLKDKYEEKIYFFPYLLGNINLEGDICWENTIEFISTDNKITIDLEEIFNKYINNIFNFELFSHYDNPILIESNENYYFISEYFNNEKFLTSNLNVKNDYNETSPIFEKGEIYYIDSETNNLIIKFDENDNNINIKTYKYNKLNKEINFNLNVKKNYSIS